MADVTVKIPAPLRFATGDAAEIRARGGTVREVLGAVEEGHPGFSEVVLDPQGNLHGYLNVYLGKTNIRKISGLDTAVDGSQPLAILPAFSGG